MAILNNRHDILILFDVTNGNPNGDPDAGNLPRIDPTTNKGLVSDVCLKRKVRNYVAAFQDKDVNGRGYDIMIRQGAVINNLVNEAEEPAAEKADAKKERDQFERAALDYLCNRYYDLRTFGMVLSTGNKIFRGSAYGQVRGPVQLTFARSIHPITPLEVSITRCAVADEKEKKAAEAEVDSGSGTHRTMGNKHIVPYALYLAKAFVSPVFADPSRGTGFTEDDLTLFFEALDHMFDHDQSAARPEMAVRAIYDFEHVGTQGPENAQQNAREAKLGCEHAHKLFAGVTIKLNDPDKEYPESFDDYGVTDAWSEQKSGDTVVPGVRLFRRVDPRRNTV